MSRMKPPRRVFITDFGRMQKPAVVKTPISPGLAKRLEAGIDRYASESIACPDGKLPKGATDWLKGVGNAV